MSAAVILIFRKVRGWCKIWMFQCMHPMCLKWHVRSLCPRLHPVRATSVSLYWTPICMYPRCYRLTLNVLVFILCVYDENTVHSMYVPHACDTFTTLCVALSAPSVCHYNDYVCHQFSNHGFSFNHQFLSGMLP